MSRASEFAYRVDCVKEDLRVNGEFDGFSDAEWALVEDLLMSDRAEAFMGLLSKARERGVIAGIDEERRSNRAR